MNKLCMLTLPELFSKIKNSECNVVNFHMTCTPSNYKTFLVCFSLSQVTLMVDGHSN